MNMSHLIMSHIAHERFVSNLISPTFWNVMCCTVLPSPMLDNSRKTTDLSCICIHIHVQENINIIVLSTELSSDPIHVFSVKGKISIINQTMQHHQHQHQHQ